MIIYVLTAESAYSTIKESEHQFENARVETVGFTEWRTERNEVVAMMDRKEINIIAVDFDGTLCSDCYPEIGMPNLPLIYFLRQLRKQGKQVILWTCRCGRRLEEATEWCAEFGLEFDAVNENVAETLEKYGTESRKISADVYIDDRACFPGEVVRYKEMVQ